MKKIWNRIQGSCENLSGVLLIAIIAIIFLQIITRYVFFYSLPWSEELSRYLFVWLLFLTLNLAIRDGIPIRIDFIDQLVKGKGKRYLDLFVNLVILAILAVFAYSAYQLFLQGFRSTSPALGVPLYFVYMALPLGYVLSMVETAIHIVRKFRERGEQG